VSAIDILAANICNVAVIKRTSGRLLAQTAPDVSIDDLVADLLFLHSRSGWQDAQIANLLTISIIVKVKKVNLPNPKKWKSNFFSILNKFHI
jgi:hypothetical protein